MNKYLINIPKPYNDEISYSYFERVAKANAFSGTKQLLMTHVFYDKDKIPEYDFEYSYLKELLTICEIDSWSDFMINHTLYPVQSIFLLPNRQISLFKRIMRFSKKGSETNKMTFNKCPFCYTKSKYLRRAHNIPGVKVCLEHRCSLIDEEGKALSNLSDEDFKFAEYASNLLTNNYETNLYYLKMKRGYSNLETGIKDLMNKYPNFEFPIEDDIVIQDKDEYQIIYKSNKLCEVIDKFGEKVLMSTRGLNYGFSATPDFEKFFRSMDLGYQLISLDNEYITIKHELCGEINKIRIGSFLDGVRCKCNHKWTRGKLENLVQSKFEGFEFVNYKKDILTLKHLACGKENSKMLDKFLTYPTCKYCNPHPAFEEDRIREVVSTYPGFEFEKIVDKDNYKIEIKHSCGAKKRISYYTFIKNPYCKCIENNKVNRIRNIISNDYSDDEIIWMDDLKKLSSIKKVKIFIRSCNLHHVAPGGYCKSNKTFSKEEIDTSRFLKRKGKVIGYAYGYSFAYELGLLPEPDIPSFATSISKQLNGKLSNYNGNRYRIKGVPDYFESQYWKEMQLAEFISGINFYLSNTMESLPTIISYIQRENINLNILKKYIGKVQYNNPLAIELFKQL